MRRLGWRVGTISARALGVIAVLGFASVPHPPTGDYGAPRARDEPRTLDTLRAYVRDQQFAAAESLGRSLLADLEAAHGRDSAATLDAILLLAEALRRNGHHTEAGTFAMRAMRIAKSSFGTDSLEYAESLRERGLLVVYDQPPEAQRLLERSLAITERAVGPDHPAVAEAAIALSDVTRWMGDVTTTRALLEHAVAIRRKVLGLEDRDTARAVQALARAYWLAGDFFEARELAEQALAIQTKHLGSEHPDVADTCNALGMIEASLGEFVEARRVYERALSIRQRSDHPEVGSSLNNLATVLILTGDYAEARRLLKQAWLDLPPAIRYHFSAQAGALNYSEALIGLGEYAEAEPILRSAIDISEKGGNPRHVASGLRLLSTALRARGDAVGARQSDVRALAVLEATLGSSHPRVADCADDLGLLLQEAGDLTGARREYERALGIREKALGPNHPDVARSLVRLAGLAWGTGETETARADAVRAAAMVRDHLSRMARGLTEREALAYEAVLSSGLDVALSVLSVDDRILDRETALDLLIRSRALVLDEIARRHRRVLESRSPQLEPLVESLDRARLRLARWVVRADAQDGSEDYRDRLEQLQIDKDEAERRLADASAEFRRDRERTRFGLSEVRAELPPDAALVSYVLYQRSIRTPRGPNPIRTIPSYLAFVLRPDRKAPAVVPLGEAESIDALARLWRREAATAPTSQGDLEKYHDVASRLRRAVWDPLRPHFGGIGRAFVVPDGALHLVNLATLPAPDGGYLLERAPLVHVLSAERDLVRETERATRSGLLVLGGAEFDNPDARSSSSFAPLPGSRAEAEEVASLWRDRDDVVVLVGPHASEAEFRRHAPGRRILHLATHTFSLTGASGSARGNPLISTGLAFRGANGPPGAQDGSGEDDGMMTAEEVASLDLRGVEWVVLSGCETAVGPLITGEGVLGLRRAFQVAGARALVITLWPIEDQQARPWIRALYAARVPGLSAAAAAARASQDVLGARRRAGVLDHPFFWGAFVAAGQ